MRSLHALVAGNSSVDSLTQQLHYWNTQVEEYSRQLNAFINDQDMYEANSNFYSLACNRLETYILQPQLDARLQVEARLAAGG
jgi:hypothetical protein